MVSVTEITRLTFPVETQVSSNFFSFFFPMFFLVRFIMILCKRRRKRHLLQLTPPFLLRSTCFFFFSFSPTPNSKSEYAYTMVGNTFKSGETNSAIPGYGAKGYVGIASYLLTGEKDLVTNSNNFYMYKGSGSTARVDRSGLGVGLSESTIGAPDGPYKACISKFDDTATGKCGADRTFKSGDYKFSIFGHFTYETSVDQLGVRMKVSCCSHFVYLSPEASSAQHYYSSSPSSSSSLDDPSPFCFWSKSTLSVAH